MKKNTWKCQVSVTRYKCLVLSLIVCFLSLPLCALTIFCVSKHFFWESVLINVLFFISLRTRIMKMRYFHSKQDEIDHLIESQPTATKAVRLDAFLPPVKQEKLKVDSNLTPIQRRRLERLIDDTTNSLVERKLYWSGNAEGLFCWERFLYVARFSNCQLCQF